MLILTRKQRWLILTLILILILIGYVTHERLSPTGRFADLQNDLKAIQPDVNSPYSDLAGKPLDLNTFKGKPLVINSWATWMPFSKDELAQFSEVKRTYGDQIEILGINRMEAIPMMQSYIDTYNLEQNIIFLSDPADTFYKAIQGYAMPETVFYNVDGTIYKHQRGVLTAKELEEAVTAIIASK